MGSDKLVSIAAGHHTLATGPLVIVDMTTGINQPSGLRVVTPGVQPPAGRMDFVPVPERGVSDHRGFHRTPWPLSEKYFLVSYTYGTRPLNSPFAEIDPKGYALYLVDVLGNKELIYRDPTISCFIPVPFRARRRPAILSDLTDPHRSALSQTQRCSTFVAQDARNEWREKAAPMADFARWQSAALSRWPTHGN